MLSIYPLLLLILSISASAGFTPPPKPPGLEPPPRKPLRKAKDIYTVDVKGDKYLVYSPYYDNNHPVAVLRFPTDNGKDDQIIIPEAYNAKEKPHTDGTPRLHLSDMIQAVASNHAHKSLASINWVLVQTVTNGATLDVVHA